MPYDLMLHSPHPCHRLVRARVLVYVADPRPSAGIYALAFLLCFEGHPQIISRHLRARVLVVL
jgi:hypothetical protein